MRALVGGLFALLLGPPASGAQDSPRERVPALLRGAVDWLVENQNDDGSWGSHHTIRTQELIAAVPGTHRAYRVGCTALAVLALNDSPYQTTGSRAAAERAIDYLLQRFDVKRPSGLEFFNTWSFAYTLQAFGEWLADRPGDQRAPALREAMEQLVQRLDTYQCLDGGYSYLDFELQSRKPSWTGMSFTTASVLVGMHRATEVGVEVPEHVLQGALNHVRNSRTPLGTYVYGYYLRLQPRAGINVEKGAACRTPLCEYVLGLFGDPVAVPRRQKSLEDLLIHHARFQKIASRRPIPHEAWYSISGYFYLYGHAYAAYVLEAMPEAVQERLWPALVEAVEYCHQPDGSFWDYPVYQYHKPYGTAFAIIALARVPLARENRP